MAWNPGRGANVATNREDEIRLRRQLEALNPDEEYSEQNDTQRPSFRGPAFIRGQYQGIGFRSGDRGRNENFFRPRFLENHPSFLLMRHENSEDRSGWNGNQSEERQPQIQGNQVSFRRFHDHSQSRGRPINRSYGCHSRSPSPFRRAPVHSDRLHLDRPRHEHAGRPKHDHSDKPCLENLDRPQDDHSDTPHHDHAGRPYHDQSDRPHHDHLGRFQHDHAGRPYLDHLDRPHLDHSERPHQDHAYRPHLVHIRRAHLSRARLAHRGQRGRDHLSHTGLALPNYADRAHLSHRGRAHCGRRGRACSSHTGLIRHNHTERVNNDHLRRLHRGRVGRAHNNNTWRSRRNEERYCGQRGRFGRNQTSPESDPEIDRTSTIREQTEYLLAQERQRNEIINLNGGVTEEGYSSDQIDRNSDSLWRPEVDAEFLNGRYTTIKTFTRHPIGGSLSHDVGARNNQTNL